MAPHEGDARVGREPGADFRLGDDWWVRPGLLRLVHGDDVVHVGPKVMGVLVYLAERAERPVSREELLQNVWPDVVVVEEVLTRAISQLRRILRDDPKRPRYIETIRGAGYRIVAPVRDAQDATSASDEPDAPPRAGSRGLVWTATFGVLTAVAIVSGLWIDRPAGRASERGTATAPVHPIAATALPGHESYPAMSPDGTRVAFVWDPGGGETPDLWVKDLEAGTPIRLTSTPEKESVPQWSPDGASIAYVHDGSAPCRIEMVSADGGSPRVLARRACGLRPDLAISPDGRWIAYSDRVGPDGRTAIRLREVDGDGERTLTRPQGEHEHDYTPAFSPDGARVAFVRRAGTEDRDLFVVPVTGGEPRRLTEDHTLIVGIAWEPDGRAIVASSKRSGDLRLWSFPLSGDEPIWLGIGAGKVIRPSFAREGRRIAFERVSVATEIWELPFDDDGRVGGIVSRIASSEYDHEAHYSPDGERLAFVSNRSGSDQVWVSGRDGNGAEPITDFDNAFVASPRWSPDGREVVLVAAPSGNTDLYAVDVASGAMRTLVDDAADERVPSWSADGRFVYFASNREDGWQVWRVSRDGRAPTRVTRNGGFLARESDDGATLYFAKYGASGVWRRPVAAGAAERIAVLSACDWGSWELTPFGIAYLARESMGPRLALLDLDTGTSRVVADALGLPRGSPAWDMRTMTVARDGRRVALSVVAEWESDVLFADLP